MRRRKKPSTHNQFYSVVKGKGHHGEKGGERWRRGRMRVGRRAGEDERRGGGGGRQTFPAQSTRAESSEVGVGMGQQRR